MEVDEHLLEINSTDVAVIASLPAGWLATEGGAAIPFLLVIPYRQPAVDAGSKTI